MNKHKIIFLSIGLLMVTKAGQASMHQPDPVGLHCQFNGAIEVSLSLNTFEKLKNIESEKTPDFLRDAIRLSEMKCGDLRAGAYVEYTNGTGIRRKFLLKSNQWVWVTRDTSIRLTLIPNGDVYFYNVFNKALNFSLRKVEFEQFKDFIRIARSREDYGISLADSSQKHFFDEDTLNYYISLEPGQAIKYPVESNLQLVLESQK